MAGTINKEHLAKLIAAWNAYATRDDGDDYSTPQYKGLSLSFDAKDWREDHPQEFPEFCKLKKAHPYTVSRHYDCGDWYLPPSIVKMVVEHEVTYEEVAAFIILLLRKRDTIEKRVIVPLPNET
jgi:hypothetical protein